FLECAARTEHSRPRHRVEAQRLWRACRASAIVPKPEVRNVLRERANQRAQSNRSVFAQNERRRYEMPEPRVRQRLTMIHSDTSAAIVQLPDTMVWIPGGTFRMGSDRHYPEEAPAHKVKVSGFWMSRHAVTNAEFSRFVDETGYVTLAERPANPA